MFRSPVNKFSLFPRLWRVAALAFGVLFYSAIPVRAADIMAILDSDTATGSFAIKNASSFDIARFYGDKRINFLGNVGIGAAKIVPGAALDVQGSVIADTALLVGTDTSASPGNLIRSVLSAIAAI